MQMIRTLNASGVVFVAGASDIAVDNDNRPVYPCAQQCVFCVASVDPNGNLSNFSGFGAET
eukprot:11543628-Heterocapsa_arctica.AAC.1